MPELPEVETIVRILKGGNGGETLVGKKISRVELLWERTLAYPAALEFSQRIKGQKILDIHRRAKFIVFSLTPDMLLIHLRMSGDLRLDPPEMKPDELAPHDRAAFYFEDGWRLSFNDARKFGRIWLYEDSQLVLGKLGPEPLDPGFTYQEFFSRLNGRHRQLKPLLMDQGFLAGLGNIYTDEALFVARLHPLSLANGLSFDQSAKLLDAIRCVLEEGIRRDGSSIDWVYRGGSFQNSFQVYQRTGKPCYHCGTPIERKMVGQRSTHFCPNCQVLINKVRE